MCSRLRREDNSLQGAANVLVAMTANAKSIFKLMAEQQLEEDEDSGKHCWQNSSKTQEVHFDKQECTGWLILHRPGPSSVYNLSLQGCIVLLHLSEDAYGHQKWLKSKKCFYMKSDDICQACTEED